MKKQIFILTTTVLFSVNTFAKTPPEFKQQPSTGISFTENKGQVHDQNYQARPDVLFSGLSNSTVYHLRNNGISYQLNKVDSWQGEQNKKHSEKRNEPDQLTIYRLDINWLGCNSNAIMQTDESLSGYNNYYLEVCPNGVLNVKSYAGITYKEIYSNINLHYYQKNGNLKYDFIVAPNADYTKIRLEIDGAETITVNLDGSVSIKTPLGSFEEGAPIVYQGNKNIPARWVKSGNVISFEIDDYDPTLQLTIDPLVRFWSTWYGGSENEAGNGVSSDGAGNSYMTGETKSSALTAMATSGAHQITLAGGYDAFLVKFNANGMRQWSTYYGGYGNDGGAACVVTDLGEIYMTGGSSSTNNSVIATPGAHQTTLSGGSYYWSDAILVKFNSSGARIWGTYYGGNLSDSGHGVALDGQGNVYMVGSTRSNTSTAFSTPGSHQQNYGGGNSNGGDGFIVKFNGNGVRQWGTFYGGGNDDYINDCAADAAGNLYIVGSTCSYNNIASTTGHQTVFAAGPGLYTYDAFAVKFNSNGQRQWGTYYGGTGYDLGHGCCVDSNGNFYISGMSSSSVSGVMTTTNSHEPNFLSSAGYAAFLTKFDQSGSRQWGTFYSKGHWTEGLSCATNEMNHVYMVGFTGNNSGTVLATPESHQQTYGGGNYDGLVVHFNESGTMIEASYYGGIGSEIINSCATNTLGSLFMCGRSDNSPGTVVASAGSHQSNHGGLSDAFFVNFIQCDTLPSPPINAMPQGTLWCVGDVATLVVNGIGTINWYTTYTGLQTLGSGSVYITPPLSLGSLTIYAESKVCAIGKRTSIALTVEECTSLLNIGVTLNAVKIFPNPSTGVINVELSANNEIIILNTIGQIVYSSKLSSGTQQINLEGLAKGVYLVRVGDGVNVKNIKVVME